MKAVGVGGGAVAGELSNNLLKDMNPMLRGGLKIAVGAIIPEFIPIKDKSLVENIGSGIIASGAIDISKNLINPTDPPVTGVDELDQFADDDSFIVDDEMYGIDEDSPIFGDDSPISGDDDDVTFE